MNSAFPTDFIAVVGMDAVWGGWDGLDACEQAIFEGTAVAKISSALHSESLLEKVTRRALADAQMEPGAAEGMRIALISTAAGSKKPGWAASLDSLPGHPNPLVEALSLAAGLLGQAGVAVDAVVFSASSPPESFIPGDLRDLPAPGFGFDRAAHGWQSGSGAGAVVLMNADRAKRENRRIYAVLRSLAFREGNAAANQNGSRDKFTAPSLEDMRSCCQEALRDADITPAQVGYVDAFACGIDSIDGIEIAGLVQAYRIAPQDLTTVLGSAQALTGYLGQASGVAGLIQTALCLYQRQFPGVGDWNGPKLPALWRGAPFYVPLESRPWFVPRQGTVRLAGLNLIGKAGSCAHLILAEPEGQLFRPNRVLSQAGFTLFPLVGDSLESLQNSLERLRSTLTPAVDLGSLATTWHLAAQADEQAGYALTILGHTVEELQREIDLAQKALPTAFEKGGEWQTPLGSYFTAAPAGRLGSVALVYPGAFNSYPGVGKDLFRLFPDLHLRSDALASDLGRVFHERMLYPRSLNPFTKEEISAQEASLLADPIAMLITGTALSVLYTYILEKTFDIRPAAAFGYSLGENSMVYATGVWYSNGDEATARLEDSDAFRKRLAGPQLAIREFWDIPVDTELEGPLWSNYLVMAPPDKVRAAVEEEPRVYMTHINTPRQVVIGGDPQACQRVVKALHCSSLQAPFDYALHCEVMRSEYTELAVLHSYPVENQTAMRLYSAAGYAPLGLEQAEIAHKMADMLTSPLDFPRLVQQVYADGARVFIEAGAGSNCARWIDETLKGSPHLALSMNRRGTDDYHTLVRMVARLFSHRVSLRLEALYPAQPVQVSDE